MDATRVEKGFETLAEILREQILRGDICAGEVLPNERALVDQSGLSRGSVREALRVLEAQGLVATRLGRNGGRVALRPGAEVVRSSLSNFIRGQRVPFPVVLEAIETLEPSLAALAALHRDGDDIVRLQSCGLRLATRTTARSFVVANTRWHQMMALASHNPILTTIYNGLGPRLLDPRVAGFASVEMRAAVVLAVSRVQEAIIAGDAETARRRMHRHVQAYRREVERVAPKTVRL